MLVLAGGDGQKVIGAQPAICVVVVRRQGLFEPRGPVRGDLAREIRHRLGRVADVAHAPPGMGVDHQPHVRADCLAHEPHGFQVLLGPQRGPHLVRGEAKRRDRRRLLGVAFGRHVHAGAAVELDAVAHPAADQFRQRAAFEPRREVDQCDFDGAIRFGELEIAFKVEVGPAAGIFAHEERRDRLANVAGGALMGGPGGIAGQAVVGPDADDHGVALEDRALAAVERQPHGLRQRAGHQESVNVGDFHASVELASGVGGSSRRLAWRSRQLAW